MTLASAVPIAANTTYVASCHSSSGYYVATTAYFAQALTNGSLTALADGTDGANGVYTYGASAFPTSTHASTNYWADVAFSTQPSDGTQRSGPDTTPPAVVATSPTNGSSGALAGTNVTATLSELLAPSTVNGTTMQLRDPAGRIVAANVAWDPNSKSTILHPTASLGLAFSTTYTATVKGGAGGVTDIAGNPLAADFTWSFSTQAVPSPPPNEGPGGPILVIGYSGNPFSRYYAEILRAEGLNAFEVIDIAGVNSTVLAGYDVAILGEMPLTAAQVTMLTSWVDAGGHLIAMRPDPQLGTLLGLASAGTTLANAYLAIDTSKPPGQGIVGETIQFHGTADRYSLAGATPVATVVATLYSNATTSTTNPAREFAQRGQCGEAGPASTSRGRSSTRRQPGLGRRRA